MLSCFFVKKRLRSSLEHGQKFAILDSTVTRFALIFSDYGLVTDVKSCLFACCPQKWILQIAVGKTASRCNIIQIGRVCARSLINYCCRSRGSAKIGRAKRADDLSQRSIARIRSIRFPCTQRELMRS